MGYVKQHILDCEEMITTKCEHCEQDVTCKCELCHAVCLQPDVKEEDAPINLRMFGNYDYCMDEAKDFLRVENQGDLYLVVCTPYDDKYERSKSWYRSPLAYRAVGRMIKSRNYIMTREYLHTAKAHINCLVYSKRDLVKELHDKNKYKYHYHVQKVERPKDAVNYIFKDSNYYTFDNGDDYVINFRI